MLDSLLACFPFSVSLFVCLPFSESLKWSLLIGLPLSKSFRPESLLSGLLFSGSLVDIWFRSESFCPGSLDDLLLSESLESRSRLGSLPLSASLVAWSREGCCLFLSEEKCRPLSSSFWSGLLAESLLKCLDFSGSLAGEGMSGGGEVRGRDKMWDVAVIPLCLLRCWGGGEREGELWRRESIFRVPGFTRESPTVTISWLWGCEEPPKIK